LLDQEVKELSGDASKVFLGGFDQGGCIALHTFLHANQHILGGVFAVNSCIIQDTQWKKVKVADRLKTPLFLYHTKNDWYIEEKMAKDSYEFMRKKGLVHFDYEVAEREDSMVNVLTKESMEAITKFFLQHIPDGRVISVDTEV
jgi:predicted esterase